ncbi:hypothetical protein RFI_24136 [Reticulomyxa filosa]|uniref:AAA+ ATPase domain-containing protein n=1 Tax=Reticulomyxa filosa TaxID=46433 RepID=X6MH59_RETFI|nr:hypothetical protein RFI_24136 [Reticulomyxa filosa]|eukprot:ETO13234.1 hypothetical protein RFI_24136 [Reticulomyxa filosa]
MSNLTANIQLPDQEKPYPKWIKEYLSFDPDDSTFVEIRVGDQLYDLASEWIVKHVDQSYRVRPKTNTSAATRTLEKMARIAAKVQGKGDISSEAEKEEGYKTDLYLGLGMLHLVKALFKKEAKVVGCLCFDCFSLTFFFFFWYAFVHNSSPLLGFFEFEFKQNKYYGIHQTVGEPQSAGYCGEPRFFQSLVLFVKGKGNVQLLKNLCDQILIDNENKKDNLFLQIYRYNVDNGYWQSAGRKIGRDVSTIILPENAMKLVTADMERFLNLDSVKWYFEHGIPYKRSYLFYGVPGSGKTSLIQALAYKFTRNLCFLQPTHPKMTGVYWLNLACAPANSLIVLEDIDALFNKDRSKKHEQCPLTFSGLLNGLDGVGNPDGQIFIVCCFIFIIALIQCYLTTNFVDQLDDALIRSGRVDVHVQFPMATDEQLERMFLLFYPDDKTLAQEFTKSVRQHFASVSCTLMHVSL